ncbi:DUF4345 family protein [Zhongshania aquimaris]|uniref:DUF4345 family protein n=1 Tax=Zhongshania aquimaris TaxID=2857107 RepID=A0ABS6VRC5_9GAMM|nr:DUF4345 family protein [Zhongshania aquimaris]MBW2940589.1 DUF4345 family protein [Zhongshania aquimaris]
MLKLLRIIVALPAILFLIIGLQWAVDPAAAAESLGMPLLDGLGRSSQIADTGALFIAMGLMILSGLLTGRKTWFYAPALMLFSAAALRLIAWLIHDAAFAPDMIAVEIVVACLLLISSPKLADKQ